MDDEMGLAAEVVRALQPYLQRMGDRALGKVEGKIGEAAEKNLAKLRDVIRAKLTARGEAKALERLEAAPNDADNQAGLRVAVKDAVAEDAAFAAQLKALLEAIPKTGGDQTATTIGDGNTTTQASGGNISINIGGRD